MDDSLATGIDQHFIYLFFFFLLFYQFLSFFTIFPLRLFVERYVRAWRTEWQRVVDQKCWSWSRVKNILFCYSLFFFFWLFSWSLREEPLFSFGRNRESWAKVERQGTKISLFKRGTDEITRLFLSFFIFLFVSYFTCSPFARENAVDETREPGQTNSRIISFIKWNATWV